MASYICQDGRSERGNNKTIDAGLYTYWYFAHVEPALRAFIYILDIEMADLSNGYTSQLRSLSRDSARTEVM